MIIKFIKKFSKKLTKNRKNILSIFSVCIIFVFFIANSASADVGGAVATVLGWIASLLTSVIGYFLTFLIKILVNVANFSNIIDVPAVQNGWVIIRDLCNMSFVLILLVIAFATILKQENYSIKKLLPKLLIMAVLINFSRMIFGLIIDFSQVIMLTFVNGFGGENAGNFLVNAFQIQEMGKIGSTAVEVSGWDTSVAIILGVIAMLIAFVVVAVMLAVLIMRVMMLWIYTILSPLVFLGFAFPPIQKYTGKIWEDFIKQVVVGPALAFFLWLALTTAGDSSNKISNLSTGTVTGGLNSLFQEGNFQTFIIVIGMLVGGLIVTQQMGGVAGAAAGKGMGWIRGGAGLRLAGKGALGLSSWGARKFAGAEVKIGKRKFSGFEIRPTKIIGGIKEALEQKKRREDDQIQSKSAAALREGKLIRGGLGASKDLTEAAAHGVFWHRAWNPLKDEKGARKGVFGQTWQAGNVRKRIKRKEEERSNVNTTEDRKKKIDGEIGELNKELENYKTPYTFYAEQTRNAAIREQQAKIGDNDNEDDLIAMFDDAVNRKDKEMAAAVMLTAAKVGHLNEIIQSQKSDKNLDYEFAKDGSGVLKAGENLPQGGLGLNELVKQKLIGELGMSEQEAYSHQSQASSLAKSIGHFNLAESIGVKNGLMYQRSDSDQQSRARGELRKVDSEKAIRNYNRLAWGDEIQYEENGKSKRDFKLSALGKANFVEWADKINKEIDLKRFQKNSAMNIAQDKEGLMAFIEDLKSQGVTQYKDEDTGEMVQYSGVAKKLITYGETVSKAEKAVEALSASAMGSGGASAQKGKTKSVEAKKETKKEEDLAKFEAGVQEKVKKFKAGKAGKKTKKSGKIELDDMYSD